MKPQTDEPDKKKTTDELNKKINFLRKKVKFRSIDVFRKFQRENVKCQSL